MLAQDPIAILKQNLKNALWQYYHHLYYHTGLAPYYEGTAKALYNYAVDIDLENDHDIKAAKDRLKELDEWPR